MLQTRLTEDYGLDVPFIGAGMAFVAMPPLAAAVSNAGGMGTLGASLIPPDALRWDIVYTFLTGKLIPKERLRAVPHTTKSIEAKLNQYRE